MSALLEILLSSKSANTIYPKSSSYFGVVLPPTGTGDENHSVNDPCAISLDDNTWAMIYTARSTTKREGLKYATSPKGQVPVWTKQNGNGDYVVQSGTEEIMDSTIIKKGGTFYLIYATTTGEIYLATGPDLDNMTKQGIVIDRTASGNFDAHMRHVSMVEKDGTYHLFYQGRINSPFHLPAKIGTSTSTDLSSWVRNATPVYDPDSIVDELGKSTIASYSFLYKNKYYLVDSCGRYDDVAGQFLASNNLLLTSDDLITWKQENKLVRSSYDGEVDGISGTSALIQDSSGLYTMSGKGSITGHMIKFNGKFRDYLPDPILEEQPFDGVVFDTDFWNDPTPDSNGITISQNEKIILSSDGAETASAHNILSKAGNILTSNSTVVVQFDYTRTEGVTGGISILSIGGNNSQGNGWIKFVIQRGTAGNNLKLSWVQSGVTDELIIEMPYSGKWQFILGGSILSWWKWDGLDWVYVHHVLGTAPTDYEFDWYVQIQQGNFSVPVIQTLDNLMVLDFASNKQDPYV